MYLGSIKSFSEGEPGSLGFLQLCEFVEFVKIQHMCFLWPKSCPPFLEATGSVEAAKVDGTSVVSRLMELRMVGGSGTCELPAIFGGKIKVDV